MALIVATWAATNHAGAPQSDVTPRPNDSPTNSTPLQHSQRATIDLPRLKVYKFPDDTSSASLVGETDGPFDIPCAYYGRLARPGKTSVILPLIFKIHTVDAVGVPLNGYVHAKELVRPIGVIPVCTYDAAHPIINRRPLWPVTDPTGPGLEYIYPTYDDVNPTPRQ